MAIVVPQLRGQAPQVDIFKNFQRGKLLAEQAARDKERLDLQKQRYATLEEGVQIGRQAEQAAQKANAQRISDMGQERVRGLLDVAPGADITEAMDTQGGPQTPNQALSERTAAKFENYAFLASKMDPRAGEALLEDLRAEAGREVLAAQTEKFGQELMRLIEESEDSDMPTSVRTKFISEQMLKELNSVEFQKATPEKQAELLGGYQERLGKSRLDDIDMESDRQTRIKSSDNFMEAVDEFEKSDDFKNMPGDAKYADMKRMRSMVLALREGGDGAPTAASVNTAMQRFMRVDLDEAMTKAEDLEEKNNLLMQAFEALREKVSSTKEALSLDKEMDRSLGIEGESAPESEAPKEAPVEKKEAEAPPKPVQNEGESDEDFQAREEEYRDRLKEFLARGGD